MARRGFDDTGRERVNVANLVGYASEMPPPGPQRKRRRPVRVYRNLEKVT